MTGTPATPDPQPTRATAARDDRPCTCHPADNPPRPCPRKYAYSECVKAAAAPVSGDAREFVRNWVCNGTDEEMQPAIKAFDAALTAAEAEGKRAALEEAMQRLTRIRIDETPTGMTPAQAANWAMGIACDEICRLADKEGR